MNQPARLERPLRTGEFFVHGDVPQRSFYRLEGTPMDRRQRFDSHPGTRHAKECALLCVALLVGCRQEASKTDLPEQRVTANARPAYPWHVPPAALATERKLDAFAKIGLDFTDAPPSEVVESLAEEGGVRCDLRAATTDTITLATNGDPETLRHWFALVTARAGLDFAADEEGILVIAPPGQTPRIPHLRARLDLEHVRRESPRIPHAKQRLDVRFHDTPLAEVVAFLRELVGISIILHPEAGDPEPIRLEADGWTFEEIMTEILRQTGREMAVRAALVILDRGESERLRVERVREATIAAEILGRRVDFRGQALEGWRVAEFLSSQVGVEVVVSEELWERAESVRVPKEPSSLGKGLEDIAPRNDLHWRIVDGVLYLY